jgi:hypothetical protein
MLVQSLHMVRVASEQQWHWHTKITAASTSMQSYQPHERLLQRILCMLPGSSMMNCCHVAGARRQLVHLKTLPKQRAQLQLP